MQQRIQCLREFPVGRGGRRRVGPDDQVETVRDAGEPVGDQGPQPALGAVADHGTPDGLGHDETDPRRETRTRVGRGGVDHEQPGAGSATPGGAHRRREVRPLTQSVRRRQHRRPQAESSERPLRRRAARMLRPARVRIRRRKPWVLARRRLFGWKVRLLTMFSHLQWWAGWARVVGEPVAFGCHRKPMTFAGKQRPRGRGSRACENSRTTGPLTVRESGHGGQTSGCGTPGWGKHPRISRSTARHPARHAPGDHAAYPQPVDNHVDGVPVPQAGHR